MLTRGTSEVLTVVLILLMPGRVTGATVEQERYRHRSTLGFIYQNNRYSVINVEMSYKLILLNTVGTLTVHSHIANSKASLKRKLICFITRAVSEIIISCGMFNYSEQLAFGRC